jgi:hypothetical protein
MPKATGRPGNGKGAASKSTPSPSPPPAAKKPAPAASAAASAAAGSAAAAASSVTADDWTSIRRAAEASLAVDEAELDALVNARFSAYLSTVNLADPQVDLNAMRNELRRAASAELTKRNEASAIRRKLDAATAAIAALTAALAAVAPKKPEELATAAPEASAPAAAAEDKPGKTLAGGVTGSAARVPAEMTSSAEQQATGVKRTAAPLDGFEC